MPLAVILLTMHLRIGGQFTTPSMTGAMRMLASEGAALTVDCGDLVWIDVDDQAALDKAERWAAAK